MNLDENGFDCVHYPEEDKSFKTFAQGIDLRCFDPHDIEKILKLCDQAPIPVDEFTSCRVVDQVGLCNQEESHFLISLDEMDHYFCMSDRDFDRILDRCKS